MKDTVTIVDINALLAYLEEMNIDVQYYGSRYVELSGVSMLDKLRPHTLAWIKKGELMDNELFSSTDGLVVVAPAETKVDHDNEYLNILTCSDPKQVFFQLVSRFFTPILSRRISPNAVVETQNIGEDVSIGAFSYVSIDVTIGNNVIIGNNVTITGPVYIGNDVIIHSGAVLGSDGFGYFRDNKGRNQKVPHLGGIRLEDGVEVGANTCIDRGTIGDTIIGKNTKIDNLCHIAHNVQIGENVLVIALSLLGGSCVLKDNSYIAPASTIKNQLTIGENSLVGMGAVVTKDVPDNKVVAGVPAKELRDNT